MKPSPETQANILHRAVATINRLLDFKLEVDIQRYIAEKNAARFRDFEEEAAHSDAFSGAGILATAQDLETRRPLEEGFFRTDVPLGAHEIGCYIGTFPIEAAAASYAFTVLEVFGDEIAGLVSPIGLDRNKAWHEDVKGFADMRDKVQVAKMRDAFGKHLGVTGSSVPEIAARRLVDVKQARNDFAHDAKARIDFDGYLEDILAIVCHIVFITTDEERISVYPFEDHLETFQPQS